MAWHNVRLELGRTSEFPAGSTCRYYLLRLPLGQSGQIDQGALAEAAGRATVRRFWPDEADRSGYVVPNGEGWAFSYSSGGAADGPALHLHACPLQLGAAVTLTEPDGRQLPFTVARIDRVEEMPDQSRSLRAR
jgi:hypothetical protein